MRFPVSSACLISRVTLYFYPVSSMNPWHSAVSPGPKQGLALPKTPGTYLPESLPTSTSKTLSPPGQVPFLAYYILPFTFFVFSPLCRVLCWPSASKLSAGKWGRINMAREMRMTLIQWFSPEFRTLKCLLYAQGKKALRRASVSYWWLTPPSIVSPQLPWTGGGGAAADLPPAHPSSHCKAIRDQGRAAG